MGLCSYDLLVSVVQDGATKFCFSQPDMVLPYFLYAFACSISQKIAFGFT